MTTVSLHLEYHFGDMRERSLSSESSRGRWPYFSHYLTQFIYNNWLKRISAWCGTLQSEPPCYFITLETYFEFICTSITIIDNSIYLSKTIHEIPYTFLEFLIHAKFLVMSTNLIKPRHSCYPGDMEDDTGVE